MMANQSEVKLLGAGLKINRLPSFIKLRLHQTLSNIASEKILTILSHFQKKYCPKIQGKRNSDTQYHRLWQHFLWYRNTNVAKCCVPNQ